MTDHEDRVRDALGAYADQIEPSTDAWSNVEGRLGGAPRRWWRSPKTLGPIAVLAAAALVAVLFLLSDDGEQAQQVDVGDGGPEAEVEAELRSIVAVTNGGRLIEMNQQGEELREIAVVTEPTAPPGLVVSSDAKTAYLSEPRTGGGAIECGSGEPPDPDIPLGDLIRTIDLESGSEGEPFALATKAAERPDHDEVALVVPAPCEGRYRLRLVGLPYDSEADPLASHPLPPEVTPTDLQWLDADRLAILDLGPPPYGSAVAWRVFDPETWTELEVHPVDLSADSLGTFGAAPGGAAWHVSGGEPPTVSYQGLSEPGFQPLFTLPEDRSPAGSYRVAATASPGQVLVTAWGTSDPGGSYQNRLYLWDGSGPPRQIADSIVAAAWGGRRPAADSETTDDDEVAATTVPSTDPSDRILVVHRNGDVVEYGPADGSDRKLREVDVASGWTDERVAAVSPDRRSLYLTVDRAGGGEPCATEIVGYDLTDPDSEEYPVADGASPAFSPDGRWLSFVVVESTPEGGCRGAIAVQDRATGSTSYWVDALPALPQSYSAPRSLIWSPDSKSIAFHRDSGAGPVWLWAVPEDSCERGPWADGACVIDARSVDGPGPPSEWWLLVGWLDDGSLVLSNGSSPSLVAISPDDFSVREREWPEIERVALEVLVNGDGDVGYVEFSVDRPYGNAVRLGGSDRLVAEEVLTALWLP